MNWRRILLGAAVAGSLAWYYGNNALDHARVFNTEKVRGDQRDYLFEAQILYRNWHGLNDPPVGFILTVRHFHALVAVLLVSDLLLVFRHRLMTTSGAF